MLVAVVLLAAPLARSQAAPSVQLTAPDGTTVTIERDDFGVARITAETEAAAFYAQGYAAAQDRLFQMETFWRAATGRIAELNGPGANDANIRTDAAVRTVGYTVAERQAQFEALPAALRTMIENYVAGVNAYIALARTNPAARPVEYFAEPLASIGITEWDVPKAMAVMQFFIRRFGEAGGQELQRLAELEANGMAWFNENRPINDPTAPTTIPLPVAPAVVAPAEPVPWTGPRIDPAVAAAVAEERAVVEATLAELGIPDRLGSYAALIAGSRSVSGRAMLLGAPQMGVPGVTGPGAANRNVTWESEILVGPVDNPTLHIAGMTVAGIPGVIIGRARDHAWTLTSGVSDNVDTYVLLLDEQGRFVFNGEPRPLALAQETINVRGADPVTVTRARMVVDADDQRPIYAQQEQLAFAYRYAFWGRELDMAVALYEVWKARTVADVEAAIAKFPVSFNFFLLHRDQTIGVYHVGRYPVRPGTVDPRLPALGDGSQEWEGFIPFASLPQDKNPAQGYYVNWNNKPVAWWNHGDVTPWTAASGLRAYDGVLELDAFVRSQTTISFEEMKEFHRIVRTNPRYPEYPGSYQQVVLFGEEGSLAENLVPPGQSAFFAVTPDGVVPSPHTADQQPLYLEYRMKPFRFRGEPAVSEEPVAQPLAPLALEAYPNPVVHRAVVRYAVPEAGEVRLELFDVLGRRVAVLAEGEARAGEARVELDTSGLAGGLYLVRLQTTAGTVTQRLTVVR